MSAIGCNRSADFDNLSVDDNFTQKFDPPSPRPSPEAMQQFKFAVKQLTTPNLLPTKEEREIFGQEMPNRVKSFLLPTAQNLIKSTGLVPKTSTIEITQSNFLDVGEDINQAMEISYYYSSQFKNDQK